MYPVPRFSSLALTILVGVLQSVPARGDTIVLTLPEFNGATHDFSDNYPLPSVTIGSFMFALAKNERLVSATLTSTFGNSTFPNTSGVEYFLDSTRVASCLPFADCYFSSTPLPWTYTASGEGLTAFEDGKAILTAVQTSQFTIRTGVSRLELFTSPSPTPEPRTVILLGMGTLVSLALTSKRRRRNPAAF